MAYRAAEVGLSVCVLERGKAYGPGDLPRSPRQIAKNFWDPSEGGHGLFQAWAFPGSESVVSAGLGGGSLIYANVVIRKDERWFRQPSPATGQDEDWPGSRANLEPHYDAVGKILAPQKDPFDQSPNTTTPKPRAFRDASACAGLP